MLPHTLDLGRGYHLSLRNRPGRGKHLNPDSSQATSRPKYLQCTSGSSVLSQNSVVWLLSGGPACLHRLRVTAATSTYLHHVYNARMSLKILSEFPKNWDAFYSVMLCVLKLLLPLQSMDMFYVSECRSWYQLVQRKFNGILVYHESKYLKTAHLWAPKFSVKKAYYVSVDVLWISALVFCTVPQ